MISRTGHRSPRKTPLKKGAAKAAANKKAQAVREARQRDVERERQLLARAVLSIEKQSNRDARGIQDLGGVFSDPFSKNLETSRAAVSVEPTSPTKHLLHMPPKKRFSDEASLWRYSSDMVSHGEEPEDLLPNCNGRLTQRARQREAVLWQKAQNIVARDAQKRHMN
jgi:hypothetical protein